jgi:hypothetical protein
LMINDKSGLKVIHDDPVTQFGAAEQIDSGKPGDS